MEIRKYVSSPCVHCMCVTVFISVFVSHFKAIQAGSFYQSGLHTSSFQDYSEDRDRYDFSPIQPLPVRQLLTNHRVLSSRSNKDKVTPGSRVDVLYVDLNDIDRNTKSSSSGRKITSNSIKSESFGNSNNQPYFSNRNPKQFQQPSYSRKLHENTRKKINIERVHSESLPAEITLNEILKIIPQVEAQFARFDRQERQMLSEQFDSQSSQIYSKNIRVSKSKDSRTIPARQSKRNNRYSNTDDRSNSREFTYYL